MTILIDVNEPIGLYNYLKSLNIPAERKRLQIGDLIVGKRAIERKTIKDLFGTVFCRRTFWQQMEGLVQYEDRAVIIEGIPPLKENTKDFNTYWGIYLGILGWKTPVIKTNSLDETCRVLKEMYRRMNSPRPYERAVQKIGLTLEEIRSDILCCTRGLGRKQAKLLLEAKGSIWNVLNTKREELYMIKGVRKKSIDNLMEVFEV